MSLTANQFSDQSSWYTKQTEMQGRKKISIKSVTKAPTKIKIRKKLMTTQDVRSLTTQVMRFNNIIPLKQQTIDDFIDKTSNYLKKVESKSTNLIRIKNVRLYKDRFNTHS